MKQFFSLLMCARRKVRWWLFIQLQMAWIQQQHSNHFSWICGAIQTHQTTTTQMEGESECLNKFSQHGSNVQQRSGLLWFFINFILCERVRREWMNILIFWIKRAKLILPELLIKKNYEKSFEICFFPFIRFYQIFLCWYRIWSDGGGGGGIDL